MAVVEGRLQIREWTDKNGDKRRTAEVIADNVYFGDNKKDSDPLDTFTRNHPETVVAKQFAEISDDDGDLPF
jgi:single-strand DNA-binding protein